MFGKPIRIGRLFGIDLTLSWSFLVLVVALSLYLAFQSPNFLIGLALGVISLSLVFASVLAHELGHSIVAQRLGVSIAEIELHFFGGAAKMLSMPKKPRDEIIIAAAGPAVSFVLAGLFSLLGLTGFAAFGAFGVLASINLMLGAFNLIPALPTDGGRILRAALSMKKGPLEATRIAVKVARVATIGLAVWGLLSGNFFTVGIAIFLWMLGTRELQFANAYSGRSSWMFGEETSAYQQSRAPQVEVFDRNGRFIGTAPGGIEASHHGVTSPEGRRVEGTIRPVLVRGPDGRIWVVAQHISS